MASDAVKFLFVIALVLGTTVACGPTEQPNPYITTGGYDVNKVSLTCSDPARCTNSVGVILTITVTSNSYYRYISIYRCTGALYESNKVITAGHCSDKIVLGNSYFKTVATPDRPSQLFKIKSVLKTFYNGGQTYSNDFAALELETHASNLNFVRPPTFISKDLTDFTALVVNQPGDDGHVFGIDAKDCALDTENLPWHISEYPSIWRAKTCKIVGSNSGGPVFARDNLIEVLGIISKSTEADRGGKEYRYSTEVRPNRSTFGHAGCFDLPNWPAPAPQCITVSDSSLKEFTDEKKKSLRQKSLLSLVKNFQSSKDAQISTEKGTIKTVPYFLKVSKIDLFASNKESVLLLPQPKCVQRGQATESSQYLRMKIYDFAPDSTLKLNGESPVQMTLKKKSKDIWQITYQINYIYMYLLDSTETLKLQYTGIETSLPTCDGSEDQKALDAAKDFEP